MPFAALLPLVMQVAPQLLGALGTPAAGSLLLHVGDAAQKVFGTHDPAQIDLQIQQDKSKLDAFKAQLESNTAELHEWLQDVQNARQMQMHAIDAGSGVQWAPIVLTTAIYLLFALVCFLVFTKVVSDGSTNAGLLVGAIITAFGAANQFFIGSSTGSKAKDVVIAAQGIASAATVKTVAQKVVSDTKKMFS